MRHREFAGWAKAHYVLGAAEQLSSQSKDLAGQVNRFVSEVRRIKFNR